MLVPDTSFYFDSKSFVVISCDISNDAVAILAKDCNSGKIHLICTKLNNIKFSS